VKPAPWPRDERTAERLLVVDVARDRIESRTVADLGAMLGAGDVLVVNDAATLPASLRATTASGGDIELRLAGRSADESFWAAVLGEGTWRTPTEHRPRPPLLRPGDALRFGDDLAATVLAISEISANLVRVRFDATGAALWQKLYRHGRVVQYAHVSGELDLWHVQTPWAARPWAFEMPSAGRPLAWALMGELRRAGVRLASVTHAAGLSATGDPAIDAALPLPERYEIPERTVATIEAARRIGGRVVAVGTSVVRALEGSFVDRGGLVAGSGETDVLLGPGTPRHIVDALLTGIHEPGSSHASLLGAFAPEDTLARAWSRAESLGYLGHEFGDKCLVLAPLAARAGERAA
jgi:S-adenosylmethionine:tRNA ribosyltransferase-isomerase